MQRLSSTKLSDLKSFVYVLSTLADVPPNAPYENVPDFAEMIETRLNDAHEGKKMVRFSMEEFRQRARHLNQ